MYTHFVSIPLSFSGWDSFKEFVFNKKLEKNISKYPHLTLCVLSLKNKREIEEIEFKIKALNISPVEINLETISILKGTIKKARVVIVNVRESVYLKTIIEKVLDCLSFKVKYPLLHCTLLNSKYNRGVPFDATDVLNYSFGRREICILKEVHLSKFKPNKEKTYYDSEFVLKLN